MGLTAKRSSLLMALCAAAALPLCADEIRLKDGKKLDGVIVGYEDNMFRVKTDFGYVLVEKDKVASIIPTAEAQQGAKNAPERPKNGNSQLKAESALAPPADAAKSASNASAKTIVPAAAKPEKTIASAAVKPELPKSATATVAVAPSLKGGPAVASTALPAAGAQPAPPNEPEVPAIREDVQGNLYSNHTHGFRMYKAPSWQLIDDARNALPNAIVAMGTSNESTLMVVGREKTKEPLDAAAVSVEKRLREVYENYQRVSQRKTVVGGSPAVEFRYRGKADEHDWSGTLVVIGRGTDIFTVLGMTYADSDLIQIQENVIAKAIGSLAFDVH